MAKRRAEPEVRRVPAEPFLATPRRLDRPTYGPKVAKFAAMLGTPFMPWQQAWADVSGEHRPDGSRYYRESIVTVPRQCGKTTWVLAEELETCLAEGELSTYTAQTGLAARKKLLKEQIPSILKTPELRPLVAQVHRGKDEFGVEFVNGSGIWGQASSSSAGHGDTIGRGTVDEAFSDVDARREQAILPAMLTKSDAQLIVCSTQGNQASVYLNRKTELGRQVAAEDPGEGICYLEFSVPLEADIYNPETWWRYHPAMGVTINEAAIMHMAETMPEPEFRRAVGNQRDNSGAESPISEGVWARNLDRRAAPEGRLALGVETSLDRRWSSLVLADDAGRVEVIDRREGTAWVPGEVERLVRAHGVEPVLDPRGPARSHVRKLGELGVEVHELSTAEVAEACLVFVDAVGDAMLRVRPHEGLAEAAVAGRRRRSGDQWFWDRQIEEGEVSLLIAATLAVYWAGTPAPEDDKRPEVVVTADMDKDLYDDELARIREEEAEALAAIKGG